MDAVTAEFVRAAGRRMRDARIAKGLSIRAAAKLLDVSHGTVGHWETGLNPVDIGQAFRLARLYGAPLHYMLAGDLAAKDASEIIRRHFDAPAPDVGKRAAA
jgi:transcriptional regulator with XRE-family HTH domain